MSSVSARGVPRTLLWFLVCTTFLGAMGIGLVNPIVPYLAERFASQRDLALVPSVLAIAYSGAAFLAAPALGALSDRFGRRPVLLLSVLGSALGYLLFGAAQATWLLIAGRLIDGLTAGNFSAAFAALADSTRAEERGRSWAVFSTLESTLPCPLLWVPRCCSAQRRCFRVARCSARPTIAPSSTLSQ